MALHHLTLKSAVNKYSPLISDKTEQEIKSEISKDDKGFDEDAVNEIYAALSKGNDPEKEPETQPAKSYVVISEFRDKENFAKLYQLGEDVSHFDQERIVYCIDKGLVKQDD